MDLILWRHAEAQDAPLGGDDLQRELTAKGEKEAARVAAWLDRQLPDDTRILCSPAVRCEQTVKPLGRKYKVRPELAPGAMPNAVLDAAGWPSAKHAVLVVGHQPFLGQTIAQLLRIEEGECTVRKGGAWWLRTRERDDERETIVIAVIGPDVV